MNSVMAPSWSSALTTRISAASGARLGASLLLASNNQHHSSSGMAILHGYSQVSHNHASSIAEATCNLYQLWPPGDLCRWVGGSGSAAKLLSCSYDGSVRALDPGAGVFQLVHTDEDAGECLPRATRSHSVESQELLHNLVKAIIELFRYASLSNTLRYSSQLFDRQPTCDGDGEPGVISV